MREIERIMLRIKVYRNRRNVKEKKYINGICLNDDKILCLEENESYANLMRYILKKCQSSVERDDSLLDNQHLDLNIIRFSRECPKPLYQSDIYSYNAR